MKELNRYDFTNDKSFATQLLDSNDQFIRDLPACDVIALERTGPSGSHWTYMRPDEALILTKLLIDAVWQVTEGYSIGESKPQRPKFGGEEINIELRRDGLNFQQERERKEYKELRREQL
jgi:hypothetical protein